MIIKSQLTNTNELLDQIPQEVVDLTKTLEFNQGELHDGLAGVKNDIKKVQTDLWEIEDNLLDPDIAMEKLTKVEDRSHRNNFQIDGIPETCEKWESCEEKLMKIIKSEWDITDDIKTDCCHHMGKF